MTGRYSTVTDEQRLIKTLIDEMGLKVVSDGEKNVGNIRFFLTVTLARTQLLPNEMLQFAKVINKSKEWK